MEKFTCNNPVLFGGANKEFSWLGNTSKHPVFIFKDNLTIKFHTAENAFQALRFPLNSFPFKSIVEEKNPLLAKKIANHFSDKIIIRKHSQEDVTNMKTVITAKLIAHNWMFLKLIKTSGRTIIEDTTHRHKADTFWGATFDGETWTGKNVLGKLWMQQRSIKIEIRNDHVGI